MAVYERNHSVGNTRANAYTCVITFTSRRKEAALHYDDRPFSLETVGMFLKTTHDEICAMLLK